MTSNPPDLVIDSQLEVVPFKDHSIQARLVSNPITGQPRTREQERWQRTIELGKGSFGKVWLEKCTAGPSSGEVRAVKELCKNPTSISINYYQELEAIAKFSQERYQDCFVRSLGWYESNSAIFITMEYIELGSLERYLNAPFSHTEARHIVHQLLEGLTYMHDNNFAHRDLKPANVLILHPGPRWRVKIADFGIPKRIDGTALRTSVGTEAYLAPEVRGIYTTDSEEADENNFSFAVDIWAIGSITFRMVTGQFAFENPLTLSDYVVRGLPFPNEHMQFSSSECKSFIEKTMAASPRCRPTSQEAISHLWIQTYQSTPNELDLRSITRATPDLNEHKTISPLASAQWTESLGILRIRDDVSETLQTYKLSQELKGHNGWVSAVAFSPNGRQLVSGSGQDKTLRIWAANMQGKFEQVQKLEGQNILISALAFSPNGRKLASGSGYVKTIRIWAVNTQGKLEQVQELEDHDRPVWALAFSPNGRQLAAGGSDRTIRLWTANAQGNLEQAQELEGHNGPVSALAFSPDGRQLVTGGDDRMNRIWASNAQGKLEQAQVLEGHYNSVAALAFSPDGRRLASGSDDKTIRIWAANAQAKLEQVQVLEGHNGPVSAVVFSPNGRQLASGGDDDKTIRIWAINAEGKFEQVQELEGHNGWISMLSFSPSGQLASGGTEDKMVRIWATDK